MHHSSALPFVMLLLTGTHSQQMQTVYIILLILIYLCVLMSIHNGARPIRGCVCGGWQYLLLRAVAVYQHFIYIITPDHIWAIISIWDKTEISLPVIITESCLL